jgi:hypothetical protein
MGGRTKARAEIPANRSTPARRAAVRSRPETPAADAAPAAVPPVDRSESGGWRLPTTIERQLLVALQRMVGNAAVLSRLRAGRSQAAASEQSDHLSAVEPGLQRQPVPPGPPTQAPDQATLEAAAREQLLRNVRETIGPLEDEAKRRLARAWQEAPGGVIAAAAIVGAAGVTYLVGTRSALPGLPAIPLDFLGGPFRGADIQLQLDGPVTSPESFRFRITFREQGAARRQRGATEAAASIDVYANPEAIAKQVDGPEFETEIPGEGPDTNLSGPNLANVVRVIGNGMLDGARRREIRPYVDLGELPPTPPTFIDGLRRIVDALIASAPGTLGRIEQVNIRVYRGGQLRFIPVRPSPRPAAGAAGETETP